MAAGELDGKVAVVTGGARRMGRQIALRLAEAGASVVIATKQSADAANTVVREIAATGRSAMAVVGDLTDPAGAKRMAAAATAKFGRIDILVNNAAIRYRSPFEELTFAEWREVLGSILDASFLCAQACGPQLMKNKGTLINIGGASAHFGSKGHAHVMTAKAGLVGLTRALARDLEPDVTVNCLVPGRIDAPGDEHSATTGPRAPTFTLDRIPAGRAGTLEEVAEAVVMLCNPHCRYINGQTIHINGGMFFGS